MPWRRSPPKGPPNDRDERRPPRDRCGRRPRAPPAPAFAAAAAGVDLDRDPHVAAEALGAETWELVRPDRPAPQDRHGPGASLADIGTAIARLEQIGRAG
jgi:hypothetical protein